MLIHPTAIIHDGAKVDSSVKVGAYAVIHAGVSIGPNCTVGEHCVIDGQTQIGSGNLFYRFCSIGGMPQDKKYSNEPTKLIIGNNNTIREFVTINTGTVQDLGETAIGDNNLIMAYVHIAHDCTIGNNTIIANSVQFAGHVAVEDWAIVGGSSAVHQFVRIGAHSMTGGMSCIIKDIPPYVLGAGHPYRVAGVNLTGLNRRGFTSEQIRAIKDAYKLIYMRDLNGAQYKEGIKQLQEQKPDCAAPLQLFIDFFEASKSDHGRGSRGISR